MQANGISHDPDAFWTLGSTMSLESVYGALRGATDNECHHILSQADFMDEHDSVLHYAATKDESWTLTCIVDFMLSESIAVDILSSRRRTALEVAIHEGRKRLVLKLLQAGASVSRRNDHGQQPLHFAISQIADPEICSQLMDFGADVNWPYVPPHSVAISPLYMTLERFLRTRKNLEKDILCAILQELISRGAQMKMSGSEEALMKFVGTSAEANSATSFAPPEQNWLVLALGYYLNADWNPLCWIPRDCCPARECSSFAAFIFSHTPKTGLSKMLIEGSDMVKYGLNMVHVLLTPCRLRYSSADDPTVNDLLGLLLSKVRAQGINENLEPGLLRQIMDRTPKKKQLERLQTLLESGYVSMDESREALARLCSVDSETFPVILAELLVAQFDGVLSDIYRDMAAGFLVQGGSRYQEITRDDPIHEVIYHQILDRLLIAPPNSRSGERVVQSVVHVFTKRLLHSGSEQKIAPASVIIYVATRLRLIYELPDIPIARHMLLELQFVGQQHNRHLRVGLEAHSADSPDLIEDGPYATPDSTRSPHVTTGR